MGRASRGATWGDDDTIVFASGAAGTGLQRVSSGGGKPAILTTPNSQRGETGHFWPKYLPGARAVLMTILSSTGNVAIANVAVLDLRPGAPSDPKVLVAGSHAHYVPSGHLVYAVAGALRAIRFDLENLTVIGAPMPLPMEVVTQSTGAAAFDVGRDGTLAYVASAATAPARTLVWVDRQGHEEEIKAPARAYAYPRLSPDGTRVALDIRDQDNDVWVWDFAGKNLTQVTRDPGFDRAPVWADDRQLVYNSQERGGATGGYLYRTPADGTGRAEPLTRGPSVQFPTSASSDGKRVLFWDISRGLFTVTTDKDHVEQPLLVLAPGLQPRNGEVSPDGQWLAYESNESGAAQISVRQMADVNAWKRQVSTGGGTQPVWARNGRELFYLALDGALMGVTVALGPTWAAGTPMTLIDGKGRYFAGRRLTNAPLRTYDVSLDGKRFLMIKQDPGSAPPGVIVVQNWVDELKRLLPR